MFWDLFVLVFIALLGFIVIVVLDKSTRGSKSKSETTWAKGTVWVKGLRIITVIAAIVGFIAGMWQLHQASHTLDWLTGESGLAVGAFLVGLIVLTLLTFLSVAGIMVFLDIACDVASTAHDTAEIKELLKNQHPINIPATFQLPPALADDGSWECKLKIPSPTGTCSNCGRCET